MMTFLQDNEENPRDIVIHGTAYVPDWNMESPVVNIFKSNQINRDLCNRTKNLPVFIEHDTNVPVGTVVDCYVDEKRNLNTFLHISGNKMVNKKLPLTLEIDPFTNKRYYTGLSMGTNVRLDETSRGFTTVKDVTPTEVSIVRNPDREGALLKNHWLVPRHESPEEFIKSKVKSIQRFDW